MKLAIKIIVPLLSIVFIGAGYFSQMIGFPKGKCDPEHHVFCENPAQRGLEYNTIQLTTEDEVPLEAWYIESPGSTKAILVLHGHGATWHEGLKYSVVLKEAGFNALYLNLRGNSTDSVKAAFTMGDLESLDAKAGIDFLMNKKKQAKVGIFGVSMGAATAIKTMSEDSRISVGVFNSPYSSVTRQISEVAKRDYSLPYFPMVWLSLSLAEIRTGADFDNVKLLEKIGSIAPRPIFLIHSKDDDYIPIQHAYDLFVAANEPKENWYPDCKGHVREWNCMSKEAEKKISTFFIKNL